MTSTQHRFYTVLGWAAWKGAKWYLARRLQRPAKARTGRILVLVALAAGGTAAVVRLRADGAGS